MITREPARLVPVAGSAFMHTAYNGFTLDDTGFLRCEPMLLGQERHDGQYAVGLAPNGMEKGAGYLTFRLQVQALT